MRGKIKVRRGVYLALNEWFKNGFTEEGLVESIINERNNHFGFEKPYRAFEGLSVKTAIQIAAAGRKNYVLELTTDELIEERFKRATDGEKELIVWVLEAMDYEIKGVTY